MRSFANDAPLRDFFDAPLTVCTFLFAELWSALKVTLAVLASKPSSVSVPVIASVPFCPIVLLPRLHCPKVWLELDRNFRDSFEVLLATPLRDAE